MNILYLHRTQARGVEGVHVSEVVKAFRRLGHRVGIVSPVGERLEGEAAATPVLARRERLFSAVSRHLPELVFEFAELLYNLHALRQARKRFAAGGVDVIFERYAIFAVAGAWLAKRWDRPLILEVNYTSCSPLVRRRSRLLRPLARWLDRRVFNRASGLVAVSSQLKQHLIQVYGVPPEKIIVLPNAADPEVFDPTRIAPQPLATGGKVIGFVGGFYPWHGLDLLLDAFEVVAQKVAEARLLLIGDGPAMPAVRERIARAGLEQRVLLTGWVPHANLPSYIAAFHVGVMPDSNDYGSPMKIFEYMSMGKPVVVPDYTPLLDAVQDGEEGKIFRARNVPEMADCLTMLLSDDAAYARIAQQARQKIIDKHNWLENGRALLRLCEPASA